jgi:hypothetical protein
MKVKVKVKVNANYSEVNAKRWVAALSIIFASKENRQIRAYWYSASMVSTGLTFLKDKALAMLMAGLSAVLRMNESVKSVLRSRYSLQEALGGGKGFSGMAWDCLLGIQ